MRLSLALESKKLDVRLLDKHLADGKITREQYDKYISELADDESNVGLSSELRNRPGQQS